MFQRDGGRCTYVDRRGEQCCETRYLELHHLQAFAKDGAHVAANLTLRCAAHNALAAEEDFGRDVIAERGKCAPARSAVAAALMSQPISMRRCADSVGNGAAQLGGARGEPAPGTSAYPTKYPTNLSDSTKPCDRRERFAARYWFASATPIQPCTHGSARAQSML